MMLAGWPPTPGMIAARYAAAGMTGPERLLESKFGFLRSVSTGFDYELLTDTDSWIIDMASRKRHANCGMMHAALDTLADLRGEYGDERMRTARILHRMSVDVAPLLDKQPRPVTENEAASTFGTTAPSSCRASTSCCRGTASTSSDTSPTR